LRLGGDLVTLEIEGSSFEGNSITGNGGSAAVHFSPSDGVATIMDSAFTGNQVSDGYQGAIGVSGYDLEVQVEGCSFRENIMGQGGPSAMYVFMWSGSASFQDCVFEGNQAQSGTLMLHIDDTPSLAEFSIVDSSFLGNTAEESAGLVLSSAGYAEVRVEGCSFEENVAYEDFGAGLTTSLNDGSMEAEVSDCIFLDNKAENAGAGIYASGDGDDALTLALSDCSFEDNQAYNGAGMYLDLETGTASIMDSVFADYYATSRGGALSLYPGSAEVTLTNVEFQDNKADTYGGAFYVFGDSETQDASVTISSGSILRNQSASGGGARVFYARLESQDTDWGDGADDNEPDDVATCKA